MHIFLTGGSGFVGARLIEDLRSQGHQITALARSEAAAKKVTERGAICCPGDLTTLAQAGNQLSAVDAIVHVAGSVEFWGHDDQMRAANLEGTLALADFAVQQRISTFIHIGAAASISTGGVIDNQATGDWPAGEIFGVYAKTKHDAERELLSGKYYALRRVVLRPPAIWGDDDPHLLPEILKAIRRRQFVWVERGGYTYDVCHVNNVCEAVACALERSQAHGIYFIRDNERTTFRTFIEQLLDTQQVKPPSISLSRQNAWRAASLMEALWRFLHLPGQPPITRTLLALIGDRIEIDDSRAREELGYGAQTSRETALAALST
ncbi:MAG: NAD-dependent epimerase/dehydratase family protein [Pseudomonadota bacterium]